jgi:adenylate cyclase, class 2
MGTAATEVMGRSSIETEVKFLVSDLENLRRRLREAGAALEHERTHEYNVCYDNSARELARRNELLRLRRDRSIRLTFKGAPQTDRATQALVRPELETAVVGFEQMDAILGALGFRPVQVYEKYRQIFLLEGVEVMLDELPFGDFVELEGPEPAIRQVAARLDLDWQRRIVDNYLQLMAGLKALHDLPFDDLTFENFAAVSARANDLFA